jgi:serine-type D-Ala-D-Ala carboxypeptidase
MHPMQWIPGALRLALPVILMFQLSGCATPRARFGTADRAAMATLVRTEIRQRHIPGAVVLVGARGRVLYREAFGNRDSGARPAAMTLDTVFDLASMTKVVATAPAVMQLAEQHALELDQPAAGYWPAFGAHGKERITLRSLLLHHSGLRADLDLIPVWHGHDTAMAMIIDEVPRAPPMTAYVYSDINFLVLGELVQRVSGLPLDVYCRERIFAPLRMTDTGFLPPPALLARMAPTADGPAGVHLGEVHDPTARRMGGVAGHAGLFSTAADLAIYARMILAGGAVNATRVLSAESVAQMTRPQAPAGSHPRGLGWEFGGPEGYTAFPSGTFGHLGYTGTMIWIDPADGLYAIVLTSRTYPDATGDAAPLRRGILQLITAAIGRWRSAAGPGGG